MTKKTNQTPAPQTTPVATSTDGAGVHNASPNTPHIIAEGQGVLHVDGVPTPGTFELSSDAPPSTLRDGQSAPPPPPDVPRAPAVADLSDYPYPFNQGLWIRCTPDTDPGFVDVIERAHFQRLDTPSVELFTSKIEPSVSGVCYTIKRATGVEVYMTKQHSRETGNAFALAQQVRAAKERALQEQQRAGAALEAGPLAPEPPVP